MTNLKNDTNHSQPADTVQTYPCPRCHKQTTWQNNAYKPFCSECCKMIDLGAWANEDYKIASTDDPFSADLSD